jgi:hypothetical protein
MDGWGWAEGMLRQIGNKTRSWREAVDQNFASHRGFYDKVQ